MDEREPAGDRSSDPNRSLSEFTTRFEEAVRAAAVWSATAILGPIDRERKTHERKETREESELGGTRRECDGSGERIYSGSGRRHQGESSEEREGAHPSLGAGPFGEPWFHRMQSASHFLDA